jgi:arylsulfatase A-like enzyme
MKNRIFLPACLIMGAGLTACTEEPVTPPNILFIFSDDHATHAIGAYGPKHNNPDLHRFVQTPNLDRLAAEGMLFTNAFCTNSICGPSRAAILTGKHSHLNGMLSNDIPFDGTQQTFPKLFQQGGYATAWIGKWHLFSDPTGFDYWSILTQQGQQGTYYNPIFGTPTGLEPETGYTATLITNRAIDWLENNRDKNKPFFLSFSHKAPHREWVPAPEDFELYKNIDLPVPSNFFDDYATRSSALHSQEMEVARHLSNSDLKLIPPGYLNEEQREMFLAAYGPENDALQAAGLTGKELALWKYQRYVKDFLRTVTSMDREIGHILDYLEESGLAKNTIVIYSSDQGFYLGDHGWYDKRWMYEESLKMPLIIRWPQKIKPGSKMEKMIQNIDYAPTFLQMAGLEVPADMQGASFLPLLDKTNNVPWRDVVYYHYLAYPDWHMVKPHNGIRSDRYKLIHYYTIDEWELFDLQSDPDEMTNLYQNHEYHEVVKTMTARLAAEKIAVGDTVEIKSNTRHYR